ncbi:uncharacterized protein LY89DRAFT_578989 [Mollisia scopiformis]|uniref:DUF1989 domain-containing protein n=1 Tax=Mollisia scopiformis TaxID=149040 RepID=A0A194XKN1_MOLSC|nr:uncharacterized protein LY89DRAFT_578989 [Mollisia scopiformis]KUJ20347.1 hypothetical protein LY89DRAFT_578989 [Mollisia scopiformis]
MSTRIPEPAYPARNAEALYGDKSLYAKLGEIAEKQGGKTIIEEFEIPIRSGKAWVVKKGQLCKLSTPRGPQVGDLNIWSLHNPRERFWASRTKQLHASHVSVGDRLWSVLPYMRPLVTIVADSLKEYGVDEVGGRCHDLLGTRCDPYVNKLLSGDDFDFQCHSNLVRAVLPYGLTEADVHDVINVFQVTGLNKDGKYFMEASPAKPGDYFTFFAETDLLCAMSACPGGDLSVYGWGGDSAQRMLETCRPLGVAVYEIEGKEEVLKDWKESQPPGYKGMHGLKIPVFGQQ